MPWLEESVNTGWSRTPAAPCRSCSLRPETRSPMAFDTIGIHLTIALGLSNEVAPPTPLHRQRAHASGVADDLLQEGH